MKKAIFILVLLFYSTFLPSSSPYISGRVIFKIQKNFNKNSAFTEISNGKIDLGKIEIKKLSETKEKNLSLIFILKYSKPLDAVFVAKYISKFKFIKWAEPDYIGKLAGYVPNDPNYSEQWYLPKIGMEDAWDVIRPNGNVTVAVIDNGLNFGHPEFNGKIWTNPNETPDDGIDNDNNGYVDDLHGWDFGMNDNNPEHDGTSYHGSQVAGLIGAATDNNVGIASVGYNVKIMPLKITDTQSFTEVIMSAGYQAMIYAADNGADVINCSWGNYAYTHLGEEAVNYALSKGCIIVAAAGNDGTNNIFYPAKYTNVLAVAATDSNDVVWDNSNYGFYVSLCAPGVGIISTAGNDNYETASGTSLSTPLVSGVAALLKAFSPNLTNNQISQRIRVSSDNIYNVNQSSFDKLLGYGRLNAYNALTSNNLHSVRMILNHFADNNDQVFVAGDTVYITATFYNYLSSINNLNITLQTDDPYISIINGNFSAENINENESFTNSSSPFKFIISNNVPENHNVKLLLEYSSADYSDFQWIELIVNPTYSDMNINKLDLTITSSGTLGYTDYPYNSHGNGLTFENDGLTRFFEAGFFYGNSPSNLMDALHTMIYTDINSDFTTQIPFHSQVPGNYADQEGSLIFNDFSATGSLNITTLLRSYAFSDEPNSNYIILRYSLINNSSNTIDNLYAGLFFDWDLDEDDYADDIVEYDTQNNYGYAYDSGFNTISTYQGVALISDNKYNFWANENDGGSGGIDLEEFTDDKKWTMLSSGLSHVTAGPSDISVAVSGGNYSLAPNDTIDVAFAIAIANNISELTQAITQARSKYAELPTDVEENSILPNEFILKQNYPNPFNPSTTIEYSIPNVETLHVTSLHVSLKIYDVLGREIATLVNQKQAPGNFSVKFDASSLPSGIYFYTLRAGNFVATKKMILLK